jgi:hypothetical protein
MVAIAIELLIHVPPTVGSVNVAVPFTHTCDGPVIASAVVLTVTVVETAQPSGKV